MKTKLLCMAVALCMAMSAMAQYVYDASGSKRLGKIENNYIYDSSGGHPLVQFNGVFATDVRSGRHLHQFRNDGRVMDGSGGTCVGVIKSSGQVMDATGGNTIGYIENGYAWDKYRTKKLGKYSGVSVRDAAYFFFFYLNRSSGSSDDSGPTRVVADATSKLPKVTIYDRDRSAMGVLFGSEYFVSNVNPDIRFDFKKTNEGMTILRKGELFATVGKDGKTVYTKKGDVYGIVDENGNAFLANGEQYGVIKEDGKVFATPGLEMPFGIVTAWEYDRHIVGLVYFVCYYGVLHTYYKEQAKKKEQAE